MKYMQVTLPKFEREKTRLFQFFLKPKMSIVASVKGTSKRRHELTNFVPSGKGYYKFD